MQLDPKTVKNILVVRNDRFGEFLLNIPAMRALKETFSNAKLTCVVDPCVKEIALLVPYIDEIIEWKNTRHGIVEKLGLANTLRRIKIDLAVMLNPSRDFNLITWLAGIPVRAGYDRKLGFLLSCKAADKKYLGDKHEVEYNLDLVAQVGASTKDRSLKLDLGADGLDKELKSACSGAVAIHPWSSDPIKLWPEPNFLQLAKRITTELKAKVIVVGSIENSEKAKMLFSGTTVTDLTGRTSLKQLAQTLRECRLLISVDSGPVHLACAVGTPALVLFRNDIAGKGPKRWGPWSKDSAVIQKDSLLKITVEEVFDKVKEMLTR